MDEPHVFDDKVAGETGGDSAPSAAAPFPEIRVAPSGWKAPPPDEPSASEAVGADLRSRVPKKAPKANLRRYQFIKQELSVVMALLVVIGFVHIPFDGADEFEAVAVDQEVVQMEEIVQTKQIVKPPPPPRPPTPVAVPNDAIIEDVELNLDAALDIDEPLSDLPPPPPPPTKEEAQAQADEEEIFVVVEDMPELIGGLAAVQKLIEYPTIARQAGVEGRVLVQFVVDQNGDVQNPTILRGIGGGCDEEALRVSKLLKFKPGRQRGKAVRVQYVLPISFKLKSNKDRR